MKKIIFTYQIILMLFVYTNAGYGQNTGSADENINLIKKQLETAGKCKINVNGDTIYIVVADDSWETYTTYHIINETADLIVGDYISWEHVVNYLQTGKIYE